MRSLIRASLEQLGGRVESAQPMDILSEWQDFKPRLKGQMRELKRAAKARMSAGFRQQIKRIKIRLQKCQLRADEEQQRVQLLETLHHLQDTRRALKRRVVVARTEWSASATTKAFYRRICNKYGDNTIKTLRPGPGTQLRTLDDKANILKDSWHDILNGGAEDVESQEAFIRRCSAHWEKVDLAALDAEITEEEVAAAIQACKIGKACGPDDMSNEWYRDHSDLLVPVLTKLFNACMHEGSTPSSFLEAFIFSISKGGDHTNPLNYRPIALLNSDYKIFTRVLAWRLRDFVGRLVNRRQGGFVPGRTIHEIIDLMEAAKAACRGNAPLSNAQVLLLDFAKAYDSLDRDYLVAVLRAKGFPPKYLKIIQAIHEHTTVTFLANGYTSERMSVTSGIRQGCPLAPLLFIIAVDLLYDEIEADSRLIGIELGGGSDIKPLKVAGYADDTAIYIASRVMQTAAIQAVKRFSAVSGLKLNVLKSAAINLAGVVSDGAGDTSGERDTEASRSSTGQEEEEVQVVGSTRYLGHLAGDGDTTDAAWEKAFAALRVRLVLAETKTNTVQQRAAIAAAIIMPKLLYVARHAWPSEGLAKKADGCIKNYVWNSSFRLEAKRKPGWIPHQLAGQTLMKGGLAIPDIYVELKALSAMLVGEWALSTRPEAHQVGVLLQERDGLNSGHIVPQGGKLPRALGTSIWAAGRPVTERHFHAETSATLDERKTTQAMRAVLRGSRGTKAVWTREGIVITCSGEAWEEAKRQKARRQKERGILYPETIGELPLGQLWLGNEAGLETKWTKFHQQFSTTAGHKLGQVVRIEKTGARQVTFAPRTFALPLSSNRAHLFREVCLCVLANFPELLGFRVAGSTLHVSHGGDDPHHSFEAGLESEARVLHTWGSRTQPLQWKEAAETLETAVARLVKVEVAAVTTVPHPALTRMRPLWTGRRRWAQTRKRYKRLINQQRDVRAEQARQKLSQGINGALAKALDLLTWKRLYRMEGVSAYHTQNLYKLKSNRLRLWTGAEQGFRCAVPDCAAQAKGGTVHLVWECPQAQRFWAELRRRWGWRDGDMAESDRRAVADIFSCRLKHMPAWLVQWGQLQHIEHWEDLQRTADEMWAIGVAVTLSAIWRWNVDRLHPDGATNKTLEDSLLAAKGAVRAAYDRYKIGLNPLTAASATRARVAEEVWKQWRKDEGPVNWSRSGGVMRVGFFDGGSRGNPGPGGSGSVVIEGVEQGGACRPIWAAATALGHPQTTNNVAELVGLQRLLEQAAQRGWYGIHIVGDSQMILRMMESRRPPKARKLQHWYKSAARLADICRVASWTHHYRRHNKAADWLANQAMDWRASVMEEGVGDGSSRRLMDGVAEHVLGDVRQWQSERMEREDVQRREREEEELAGM